MCNVQWKCASVNTAYSGKSIVTTIQQCFNSFHMLYVVKLFCDHKSQSVSYSIAASNLKMCLCIIAVGGASHCHAVNRFFSEHFVMKINAERHG